MGELGGGRGDLGQGESGNVPYLSVTNAGGRRDDGGMHACSDHHRQINGDLNLDCSTECA